MTKATAGIFIFLCFITINLAAQHATTKPDFSGVWMLDGKMSKIEDSVWNDELEISHVDPELKITLKGVDKGQNKQADIILYTDKRGEINRPYFSWPDIEITSKTYWRGNSLVREYKKEDKGNKPITTKTTETYILSKDQKTLTLTVDRASVFRLEPSSPPIEGRVTQKFVYWRT